ncbi:MAG: DeoR family transcriptional regulator [Alphaproteobacteria bacterium]|nr:DeoR family transcriptional regulator [Alphaproteobacteria bacterium]
MILLEIKEYIQKQKRVSLQDVAAKFDLTADTAKQMLSHWERKGKIIRESGSCRGCSCCQSGKCCSSPCGAVYLWKDVNT